MTDAPKKIWATRGDAGTGCWNAERSRMLIHMPDGWETEYTRTDIANARIAELEAANDDLRERYKAFACWAERKLSGIKTEEAPCSQL
jgi:hypothetical protein